VKHTRLDKRASSTRAHPLVKIEQITSRTEKREPKLSRASMNVMAEDISCGNAQLG